MRSAGTARAEFISSTPFALRWPQWHLLLPVTHHQTTAHRARYCSLKRHRSAGEKKSATRWGRWEPQGTATMCFNGPRQMKLEPAELRGPKTPRYILYNWRGEIKWQGHTDAQTVGTRNTKAHMDLDVGANSDWGPDLMWVCLGKNG